MRKEEVVQTVLVEFYRTNNMGESVVRHEIAKDLALRILKKPKDQRPASWKNARLVQVAEELDLGLKKKPVVIELEKEEEPKKRGPKNKTEESTDETE